MIEYLRYRIGTIVEHFYQNRTNEHIFAISRDHCVSCKRKTHWIHADFAVRLHPQPRACTMIHWHKYVGETISGYYNPTRIRRIGPFL